MIFCYHQIDNPLILHHDKRRHRASTIIYMNQNDRVIGPSSGLMKFGRIDLTRPDLLIRQMHSICWAIPLPYRRHTTFIGLIRTPSKNTGNPEHLKRWCCLGACF
jgi:hypothetical protein